MTVQILLYLVGLVSLVLGIVGCVVPVLPGPVLAFGSLILISIPGEFTLFSLPLLIVLCVAAFLAQILDNVFPVLSSKKAGAGKGGIWGAVIGMVVGMLFFPPLGMIIGAFLGAFAGELLFNKENEEPLKAALGVFTGTLLGIVFKLIVSGIIAFFFFSATGRYFGA